MHKLKELIAFLQIKLRFKKSLFILIQQDEVLIGSDCMTLIAMLLALIMLLKMSMFFYQPTL